MPNKQQRLYWDACVFLALISDRTDAQSVARRETCSLIFDRALRGEVANLTSVVSIPEVLRTDDTDPMPEEVKERVLRLFDQDCIILVSADLARAEEAREFRWQFSRLKTPDAIHLASACHAKVDLMHTYDGDGVKWGLINLGGQICNPPLTIMAPVFTGQASMCGT